MENKSVKKIYLLLKSHSIKIFAYSIIISLFIAILDLSFYYLISRIFNYSSISIFNFNLELSFLKYLSILTLLMVSKNFLYLTNISMVRGYGNDFEYSLIKSNIRNFLRIFVNDRFNKKNNITEDIYYSIYITKLINNILIPIIKLLPEIITTIIIVIFLCISFIKISLFSLIFILLFIPLYLHLIKLSTIRNKKAINLSEEITILLKYISLNRPYIFVNFNENYFIKKIKVFIDKRKKLVQETIILNNINRPIIEFIILIIIVGLFIFNVQETDTQVFLVIFLRLSQQILIISNNLSSIKNHNDIIDKTYEIEINSKLTYSNSNISINISEEDYNLLNKFIDDDSKGILLVKGESGVGKSTSFENFAYSNKMRVIVDYNKNVEFEFKNFNYIPQSYNLYKSLIEDLNLFNPEFKVNKENLAHESLLNIKKLMHNQIVSGGEAVRFSILKNIEMFKENNLIIDEPTNGLDTNSISKLKVLLEKISLEKKIIIITHNSDFFKDAKSINILKNKK